MSDISSNFLFHFTPQKEFLKEALSQRGFSPRYSFEDLSHIDPKLGIWGIGTLMKCFCDIPLNKLMTNHIDKYGKYGIGLKKEWGIKNNLLPIHYIPKNPDTWYSNNLKQLYAKTNEDNVDSDLKELIINYFIYTKSTQDKGYTYYDEREWRYIPSIKEVKKVKNEDLRIRRHYKFPNDSDIKEKELKKESDNLKKNPDLKLKFSLNDIKYIITEKKCEHKKLIEILKTSYGRDKVEGFIKDQHIEFKTVKEIIKNNCLSLLLWRE